MNAADILNQTSPLNPRQLSGEGSKEDEKIENYIEGSEYIPLPSKGVFYTWAPEFVGLEKLRVRQLNYTDEDILTTRSYLEDGSVFFELLKNVIVDKNGFPSNGLVPVDRDTILLWLRSTAFGNIFSAKRPCPKCQHENSVEWDISKFEIPEYNPEVLEELRKYGELTITTPRAKHIIKISVPSIGKTKEYEKSLEVKKKNLKIKSDLFGTGSLMLVVSGVESDGKVLRTKSEIESFFNKVNLTISDARYIKSKVELINLQYDTKQDIKCESCEYVQEGVEMPIMHPNFFWMPE
jgi:hypothetical protein